MGAIAWAGTAKRARSHRSSRTAFYKSRLLRCQDSVTGPRSSHPSKLHQNSKAPVHLVRVFEWTTPVSPILSLSCLTFG